MRIISTNKTVYQKIVKTLGLLSVFGGLSMVIFTIFSHLFTLDVNIPSWLIRSWLATTALFYISIYFRKSYTIIGELYFDNNGLKLNETIYYLWNDIDGSIKVKYHNYRGEKAPAFSKELISLGINKLIFKHKEEKVTLLFLINNPIEANHLDDFVREISNYHQIEYWKKGRKIK